MRVWCSAAVLVLAACAGPAAEPFVPVPEVMEELTPCSDHACGEGCGGGFCNAFGECGPSYPESCPVVQSGRESLPGAGAVFVVNAIAIAGPDRGFDLDGKCNGSGCIDNQAWVIGQLGNDQIRQSLLGGESLVLVELARDGDDLGTLKIYGGRDADDPFFPANNFKVPPGHTRCCEFLLQSGSLSGSPTQARARLPVRIEDGHVRSVGPGALPFGIMSDEGPLPALFGSMERVFIHARLAGDNFDAALLSGALPIADLARRKLDCTVPQVHFCADSILDSYLNLGLGADIDLDFDGLERVLDEDGDGKYERCLDGDGTEVPPIDPADPKSCVERPQMADGISVTFVFTAVKANIVGVAP